VDINLICMTTTPTFENCLLTVIDVQGTLARIVREPDRYLAALAILIKGLRLMNVPVLWLEQRPKHLGPTVPEIAECLDGITPLAKESFSCCGCEAYIQALEASGRQHVLLAGIETHICVYQTARDLCHLGCSVEIVADACSSRTDENTQTGLAKARACGAGITSVETVLFELLQTAQSPRFKDILRLVK
jgi:nicotinamidase-related amidase